MSGWVFYCYLKARGWSHPLYCYHFGLEVTLLFCGVFFLKSTIKLVYKKIWLRLNYIYLTRKMKELESTIPCENFHRVLRYPLRAHRLSGKYCNGNLCFSTKGTSSMVPKCIWLESVMCEKHRFCKEIHPFQWNNIYIRDPRAYRKS